VSPVLFVLATRLDLVMPELDRPSVVLALALSLSGMPTPDENLVQFSKRQVRMEV
jgi:hypothetical protein